MAWCCGFEYGIAVVLSTESDVQCVVLHSKGIKCKTLYSDAVHILLRLNAYTSLVLWIRSDSLPLRLWKRAAFRENMVRLVSHDHLLAGSQFRILRSASSLHSTMALSGFQSRKSKISRSSWLY
jgi:hypothetical protein